MPAKKPKSLWRRFLGLKLNERLSLLVGVAGVGLATFSLYRDIDQDAEQRTVQSTQSAISAQAATFEAIIRTTSAYQAEEQIRLQETQATIHQSQEQLQQTQTALDTQLTDLYRQQAFPHLKVADPPLVVNLADVDFHRDDAGMGAINGRGALTFILANDGGGQAGLVGMEWQASSSAANTVNLGVSNLRVSDRETTLPLNVPGQTATAFTLSLIGQVSSSENLSGIPKYELGQRWIRTMEAEDTYLDIQFSNADALKIPIEEYQSGLQIVSLPWPSIFNLTARDDIGQACFLVLRGDKVAGPAFGHIALQPSGLQSERTFINSNACFALPVGDYEFQGELSTGSEYQVVRFSVQSGRTSEVTLSFEIAPVLTPQFTPTALPTPPFPWPTTYYDRISAAGGLAAVLAVVVYAVTALTYVRRALIVEVMGPTERVQAQLRHFTWAEPRHVVSVPHLGKLTIRGGRRGGYRLTMREIGMDKWVGEEEVAPTLKVRVNGAILILSRPDTVADNEGGDGTT